MAARAGVSTATVSHVLNGTRYVSDPVQQRVFKAVKEVDYRPNQAARSLRKRSGGLLGVVLSSNLHPYYTEVLHWINQAAVQRGYTTIVCYPASQTEEISVMESLINRGVEGLILNLNAPDSTLVPYLKKLNQPFLLLNRILPKAGCSSISNKDGEGVLLALRFLYSLGHRHIAFITCRCEDSQIFSQRFNSYRSFMQEKGLFDENLVFYGRDDNHTGTLAFDHFLGLKNTPTAVFCYSDTLAIEINKIAHDRGLRVPEDLSIVGFDDIDFARYMNPPLTTVKQDIPGLAEGAMSTLLKQINDPGIERKNLSVDPELIIRESVCRVGEGSPWQP